MTTWPSLKIRPHDLILVRALALEVASDGIKARFHDGANFLCTVWVPTRECSLTTDAGELPTYRGWPVASPR